MTQRRSIVRARVLVALGAWSLACHVDGAADGSGGTTASSSTGDGADSGSGGDTACTCPPSSAWCSTRTARPRCRCATTRGAASLPAQAWQLWGQVAAIDPDASYDPVYALPVEFAAPTSITAVDGGLLTLQLEYADAPPRACA
ncbi:MAG: hypothetical protein U0168_07945 [Nannocystaceae bacterium]